MEHLRVGVIGTGRLGRLHAVLYNNVRHARLIGVHDLDGAKAEAVADETGSRAFASTGDLLAEVDAVNIATPTTGHHAIAKEALTLGKHVFIEKPITRTLAEANELIAAAAEHQCCLQVGHIERFNQGMRALQTVRVSPMFIESHRIAPFNPRGTDVDVVLDLMIHDLDIILMLVDSKITRVDASGVSVISREPDIANARITFENGCVANITASRISQKRMRKMRLFEPDSYVTIDFVTGKSERFSLAADPGAEREAARVLTRLEGDRTRYVMHESLQAPEGNALELELTAFVSAALNGEQPQVTAEDGRRALDLAARISTLIKNHQNLPEADAAAVPRMPGT